MTCTATSGSGAWIKARFPLWATHFSTGILSQRRLRPTRRGRRLGRRVSFEAGVGATRPAIAARLVVVASIFATVAAMSASDSSAPQRLQSDGQAANVPLINGDATRTVRHIAILFFKVTVEVLEYSPLRPYQYIDIIFVARRQWDENLSWIVC